MVERIAKMRRRDFVAIVGASGAWPLAARAQPRGAPVRRLGVLMARAESDPVFQALIQSFRTHLTQLGWRDGDNLRIDYRWTAGIAERFRTAAAELISLRPDVILADATPSVLALRQAQTIPIVFLYVTDPVAQGFIPSLAHPGGNLTGFTNAEFSLGGKWLNLLKDAAPTTTRVGLMFNPTTAPYAEGFVRVIESAAPSYRVTPTRMPVQSAGAIAASIADFAGAPTGGLLLITDSFFTVHREALLALAIQHRLPTIFDSASWARTGGLMAYGADGVDMFRGAASYVDRILRGAKPADLPVQAPTKFILSVNLKTAKALGLTINEAFLLTADEVIE
jgi:putative tryptophan/tyrosine transport system substrate-binding protein